VLTDIEVIVSVRLTEIVLIVVAVPETNEREVVVETIVVGTVVVREQGAVTVVVVVTPGSRTVVVTVCNGPD
jgi:hypothetical protein